MSREIGRSLTGAGNFSIIRNKYFCSLCLCILKARGKHVIGKVQNRCKEPLSHISLSSVWRYRDKSSSVYFLPYFTLTTAKQIFGPNHLFFSLLLKWAKESSTCEPLHESRRSICWSYLARPEPASSELGSFKRKFISNTFAA